MKKILLFWLVICAALFHGTAACAFSDSFGVGLRAMALGEAFTAVADDHGAAYYNPAGLAQGDKNALAVEFISVQPNIDINFLNGAPLIIYDELGVRTNPTNGSGGDGLDFYAPVLGVEVNINAITDQFVEIPFNMQLGALVSLTEDFNNLYRVQIKPPDQPMLMEYGDNVNDLVLNVGVGVELMQDLIYVGGGIHIAVVADGTLYALNTQLGTAVDDKYVVMDGSLPISAKFSPVIGLLLTPLDGHLKLGLNYRGETGLDIDPFKIVAKVPVGGFQVVLPLIATISTSYRPPVYSAGLAFDFDPFLISVQADMEQWSRFEYCTSAGLKYLSGQNGLVGIETGNPDFNDVIDYRIGLEYTLMERLHLMAGYHKAKSPVPDQSYRVSNFIDMDQDIYSFGISYDFKKPLTVGLTAKYYKFDGFTVSKDGVKGYTWGNGAGETQQSYRVEDGHTFQVALGVRITI